MRKSRAFALTLALTLAIGRLLAGAPVGAQEWGDADEWDFYMVDLYARGDQTFTISAGVTFPALFVFRDGLGQGEFGHGFRPVGGSGSLAYTYFLGPNFFLGGEIGVKFNGTVGGNTVFIIPMGVRAGWQFVLRRFEFPVTLAFGWAPQRHAEASYAGVFLRAGASAFFRFSPEWSFGLNADWTWLPQRPRPMRETPEGNRTAVDANFVGVTLAARYHF